jgi:hypothetical protein
MTRYPGNRWFVTLRLLMLIKDGGDRLVARRSPNGYYESAEWYGGVRYESVLPEPQYIQGLPAALASFEPRTRRVWAALTRPFRRACSGGWSGRFDFSVGPVFLVEVAYQVAWRWGRLAELAIWLPSGAPLTQIAREELDLMCLG